MNKNSLKAAVKKYAPLKEAGKVAAEIGEQIAIDEYSPEDSAEILAALFSEEQPPASSGNGNPPPVKESKPAAGVGLGPNSQLELAGFDYKNLTGKAFKEYVELVGDRSFIEFDSESGEEKPIVGKLSQDDSFDFELYKVNVAMKVRFPGIKDSPNDFIGVKIKSDSPVHTSRIPVRLALEHNAQILNAHSRAGHGTYYLLKK